MIKRYWLLSYNCRNRKTNDIQLYNAAIKIHPADYIIECNTKFGKTDVFRFVSVIRINEEQYKTLDNIVN